MSGNIVTFVAAGSCTMAADQAGNVSYAAAPQVTQLISVSKLAQTIELTSTPPSPAYINGTYTVGATGGGSGKPVVITTSPAAVCTVSGVKVTFVGVGTCTIGANQAGSGAYDAAAQKTQTVPVMYRFEGFASRVNNGGTLNAAKAGQVIPLKWRLSGAAGLPITNLTTATVTAGELACVAGSTPDQVAESAASGSRLQNLGDGYYQLNWKSPASYTGTCKTLKLTLGNEGVTHTALFQFTK